MCILHSNRHPCALGEQGLEFVALSEEEGFEPPVPCRTSVFKTDAFGHSATLPQKLMHYYSKERPKLQAVYFKKPLTFIFNTFSRTHFFRSLQVLGILRFAQMRPSAIPAAVRYNIKGYLNCKLFILKIN